jgi:hypothetical protein
MVKCQANRPFAPASSDRRHHLVFQAGDVLVLA